jgi:hypothetical protein
MKSRVLSVASVLAGLATLLVSAAAHACACGCSVFNVGQRAQMPTQPGLSLFLQYSFMNQNENWHGSSSADASLNDDKDIRTHFMTLGARYMFSRAWGVMATLPAWDRYLRTQPDTQPAPISADHLSLSDATLMGLFTGLSDDMSTGLELGVKLPTGPHDLSVFDPDTEPGYGSTSIVAGAYHMGQERNWGWWVQGILRAALYAYQNYRPGNSYNISVGAHYDGLSDFRIVPSLNLIASIRQSDSGAEAEPDNTGFFRFFASPGVEVLITHSLNLYGEFEIPVYTYTRGYQLVAPWLVNATLSYNF